MKNVAGQVSFIHSIETFDSIKMQLNSKLSGTVWNDVLNDVAMKVEDRLAGPVTDYLWTEIWNFKSMGF